MYLHKDFEDKTNESPGGRRGAGGTLQHLVGRSYGWLAAGRGWLHHEPLSWNSPFTSLLLL